MRGQEEDTPPSSINGDEISMDDELMYFEEVDEAQLFGDGEDMEEDEQDYEEMEPPEDHSTLVFSKHVGSVFCCDLHPDGKLAVTGGEDDKAYVWSAETGQVIMECVGHKDSVVFVGFSFDGAYLATADMSGVVKVWKVNTEETEPREVWPVVFEYETNDLTWGLWHFGTRVLICGVNTGDIYVFKIPSGDTKVLQGHNVKVECGKLFNDGVRLVAGYEDGALKVWDLKTCAVVSQMPVNIHKEGVTALDTHQDNNLVASISPDGTVVLFTSTNGKVVSQQFVEKDLETVAFSKEPAEYFALGTLSGAVSVWDIARQMLRHQSEKAGEESVGVTKMLWVGARLVTAALDGALRVYDARSGARAAALTGHRSAILDLCYNAKQNIILTTSDDDTARIFKFEVKDND